MDDQHDAEADGTHATGSQRTQQHDPAAGDGADALLGLRAALDGVDELPLAERAEVFERTHEVVVEELRALELG